MTVFERAVVVAAALCVAGLLCLAKAQVPLTGAGKGTPGVSGNITALDGSAHANAGSGGSVAASLTTTSTNDIIYAVFQINACGSGNTDTVSGGSLSWSKRTESASSGNRIFSWFAIASSTLSSASITASCTGGSFITLDVFGISGANTSAFDANAAVPAHATSGTLTISTSNANDFIVSGYRCSNASPTVGTGFTLISGANFALTQYKIVTATQSSLNLDVGGCSTNNGSIGDAAKSN